ncbi:hypothetical protein BOX15_Mlig018739g2 [Macrostomum lignano]|uniref:CUB domain-containing protein n=1 Tax=Macrostomum lignano TaxID=282301 RepID=A0A267G912_9PLAT|nr:hypothetical protein BOX15_Mlig018739g2 [Macrostomum lignano]
MKLLGLLIATIAVSVDACPTLFLTPDRQSGVLSSNYGYPRSCSRNYVNRLDCTYELISGRNNYGNGVNISFAYFSVETRYDRVYIEYTNSRGQRVTGYFTGSLAGFSRQLPAMRGTPVTLRWVTDRSVTSVGFLLRFNSRNRSPERRFRLGGTVNIVGNEARGSFRIDPFKKK